MMDKFKARKIGQVPNPGASMLTLREQRFEGSDFSRRNLDVFRPISCIFIRCDFRFWTVKDMCFASGPTMTLYRDCQFDGSRLSITVMGPARFERCSFRDVDIRGLMCPAAEFVDCIFTGVIRTATFRARVAAMYREAGLGRECNDFRGNDFTGASFHDVSFGGGIDLGEQRLPLGDDYALVRNALPQLIRARDVISEWPDAERRAAMAILQFLTEQAEGGQRDLFITKDSFGSSDRRTLENLLSLLT